MCAVQASERATSGKILNFEAHLRIGTDIGLTRARFGSVDTRLSSSKARLACNGTLNAACSASVNHNGSAPMEMTLTKTAVVDTGTVYTGSVITYTVKVSNATGKPVTSGKLADTWPTAEVGAPTAVTCVQTNASNAPVAPQPASCFDPVTLQPGDVLTYTAKGTVTAAAGTPITNTAAWTPEDAVHTTCTSIGANCTAAVTHTVSDTMAVTLTKTATPAGGTVYAGNTIDYVVTVTNVTGKPATSGKLSDVWPTAALGAPSGATCELKDGNGVAVTPAPTDCLDPTTSISLLPGHVLTYKARGTVVSPAPAGAITNTATWTPDDTAHTTCTSNNVTVTGACSATVSHNGSAPMTVTIAKTATPADGSTVLPGSTIDYVVTVTNTSAQAATSGKLSDVWPTAALGAPMAATCELKDGNGAAVTPAPANCLDQTASISLLPGHVLTYKARGTVVSPAPATIANTATWVPDDTAHTTCTSTGANCSATVNHKGLTPMTVTLTKSATPADGSAVLPGSTIDYVVTVTNTSAQAATSGKLSDAWPTAALGAPMGAICELKDGNGAAVTPAPGNCLDAAISLQPGYVLTYKARGTVVSPAPAAIANTATWVPDDATHTTCTSTGANCSATVSHKGSAKPPVLAVSNRADPDTVAPGGTTTFTVVATNNSGSAITDGVLTTDGPANITLGTWACTAASGGAVCPRSAVVAKAGGPLNLTGVNLPVGGSLTYTATGTTASTLKDGDSVTLLATLTSATAGVNCTAATPCTAPATVNIKVGAVAAVTPVPVDARWMLLALSVLLGLAAIRQQRKR